MKISTLSANLDDAVTELHHRNDYYELLQDNGKLRAVIEETSKTVQGAVQLRAESLRELAADNEALEARVLELQAEMDGMKAAIARTTELEAQVEAARVSETRLMAVIDGYKQDVEQERLKAMAAELENLKEVQVQRTEEEREKKRGSRVLKCSEPSAAICARPPPTQIACRWRRAPHPAAGPRNRGKPCNGARRPAGTPKHRTRAG